MYAHFHTFTNFTFLTGASHPQEYVERAMALGYRALAITDECSLAGIVKAYRYYKDLIINSHGVKRRGNNKKVGKTG